MMKKLTLEIIALLILSLAAKVGYDWYRDNRASNFSAGAVLYVRPDTGVQEVLDSLRNKVKDMNSLQRAFKAKEVSGHIKPGHYVITPTNSSVYVARMLNNGWQSPVNLVLSGTMRSLEGISRKVSRQLMLDSAAVRKALGDENLLKGYGVSPSNVFSLFIPDTYEMYWTASVEDLLSRMKAASDAFWTEENLKKAKGLGLTRNQTTTLASIVCAESNYRKELPKIAGVYLNRLSCGMLLQADPTVAFCFNYLPERILKKHLEVDSPYNTYKHAGLPPGPICVPTRECLEAVLNPDYGGGNLYFCANPDFSGTHVFARTLSEHNANARAFQAELNRRHAAKLRAER